MKKVTNFIVETCMNALIHTNGKTTTLEVKEMLRALGYFATQEDVSVKMREVTLTSECIGTYSVTDNGTFRTYRFDLDSDMMFNYGIADEYTEDSNNEPNGDLNDTLVDALNPVDLGVDMSPIYGTGRINASILDEVKSNDSDDTTPDVQLVQRDPERIYYFSDDVDAEDAKWVVFHKDMDSEFHIFDERLTRDNVRSSYASHLGVPIQDVRSRRAKNFMKSFC